MWIKTQLSHVFLSPQITQILQIFLANGFAITQIFSDFTEKKALQGYESL